MVSRLVGGLAVFLLFDCANGSEALRATSETGDAARAGSVAFASSGGSSSSGGRADTGGASAEAGHLGTSAGGAKGVDEASIEPEAKPECPGTPLAIGSHIAMCMPPVVCTSETCPPPLGECVDGTCVYRAGYRGIATLPEAWVTYYCSLPDGGCHGVTQLEFPEITASKVAQSLGAPLCGAVGAGTKCVGIAASSPMVVGNSQEAVDPRTGATVRPWGLGLTEASGLCYELKGPGGTVVVALTDRCGGYCKCKGSGYQECGPCVNAADMEPNCGCVGAVPGLYASCCGRGCSTLEAACDWCASNNHPHFDLDTDAFLFVCGSEAPNGSCRLTSVTYVSCMRPSSAWPP